MDNDVWLIVLGAGLAIVTQLVSEFFRHRNEDRRATRIARLDVYAEFLMAMGARNEDEAREVEAVSRLGLVAPDDTRTAASHLWALTNIYREARLRKHDIRNAGQEGSDAAAARREFTALAQRDLGITDLSPNRRAQRRSEEVSERFWGG